MIHLRKFNESGNQDYYIEISSNEFDNLINDPEMDSWDSNKMKDFYHGKVASTTWESFTDNEVNRIKLINSISDIDQMANSEGIKYELCGKIKSRLNILGYDMRTRKYKW